MERELTPQQRDYLARVDRIYEEKLKPYLEEWDAMGGAQVAVRMPGPWVDFWTALRDNDFTGLRIPRAYGGPELDLYTVGLLIEHACFISRSGSYSQLFTQNDCPTEMLRQVGTEDQRQRYFRRMREGGLAAALSTEPLPGAGLDPGATQCLAIQDGDYYLLNGQKWFAACNDRGPFGKNFSYAIVKTDPDRGAEGLSMFLISNDNPGLILGREGNQVGIRIQPRWESRLENCRVHKDDCLGGVGNGFRTMMVFTTMVNAEFSPFSVGIARAAIDYTADYLKKRLVFGKPVADNQGIYFELADLAINTEAGRQLCFEALALYDRDPRAARRLATASKVFNGLNGINVTNKCFLMFGGRSFEKGEGHPLERLVRDALASTLGRGFNLERRYFAETLFQKKLPL
jgi:alkylation response protein AidB-like acyl-CoA dehydrogenase